MKIIKAEDLPEGENVYLKKDFIGWRVVEPYKNPDTGEINYFNLLLGGKRNLLILAVIILLVGMFYMGTKELISNYKTIADNPCNFCKDCQSLSSSRITNPYNRMISFEHINISGGENR